MTGSVQIIVTEQTKNDIQTYDRLWDQGDKFTLWKCEQRITKQVNGELFNNQGCDRPSDRLKDYWLITLKPQALRIGLRWAS